MSRKAYFTQAWSSPSRRTWQAARDAAFDAGYAFSVACHAPADSVLYRPHGARA